MRFINIHREYTSYRDGVKRIDESRSLRNKKVGRLSDLGGLGSLGRRGLGEEEIGRIGPIGLIGLENL